MFNVCRHQFDQMTAEADQYGNELRSTKVEISELNRMISRLQNEILAVKAQVSEKFIEFLMDYKSKETRLGLKICRMMRALRLICWEGLQISEESGVTHFNLNTPPQAALNS